MPANNPLVHHVIKAVIEKIPVPETEAFTHDRLYIDITL